MARESTAERRARMLRETFEGQYGDHTVPELKNTILVILNEKEDLEEQKKAHNDSFKELIKEKKDALQYCRERIVFLNEEERTGDLEAQADRLLSA